MKFVEILKFTLYCEIIQEPNLILRILAIKKIPTLKVNALCGFEPLSHQISTNRGSYLDIETLI